MMCMCATASDDVVKPVSQQKRQTIYRTLSHENEALQRTFVYQDKCKEGDTILMNYFTDYTGITILAFLKKENGVFNTHYIHGPIDQMPKNWTYDSTVFKL